MLKTMGLKVRWEKQSFFPECRIVTITCKSLLKELAGASAGWHTILHIHTCSPPTATLCESSFTEGNRSWSTAVFTKETMIYSARLTVPMETRLITSQGRNVMETPWLHQYEINTAWTGLRLVSAKLNLQNPAQGYRDINSLHVLISHRESSSHQ